METMSEDCRRAFQASLELIKEKCGVAFETGGKVVRLEEVGATVTVPPDVAQIASDNPELTREQRIAAIEDTAWAQNWAGGMCRLVAPELGGDERTRCITRLAHKLAERVV